MQFDVFITLFEAQLLFREICSLELYVRTAYFQTTFFLQKICNDKILSINYVISSHKSNDTKFLLQYFV